MLCRSRGDRVRNISVQGARSRKIEFRNRRKYFLRVRSGKKAKAGIDGDERAGVWRQVDIIIAQQVHPSECYLEPAIYKNYSVSVFFTALGFGGGIKYRGVNGPHLL
jgi:hypothetical protein